ncbi:MAG: oxalate:formate antiporter [Clostridia bacterium]|nr:oxalate:formate antiporter [Clostridia bacterium]
MSQPIERARNGCTLHGALKAAKAVQGFIPIVHSNAGCSIQEHLGGRFSGSSFGAGHLGGFEVPSSNIQEKQIIFGGTSRLREQIKNTVKVLEGDLYLVLSGCSTEIVGDDIPAMTKEAREQGYPVIHIGTPGFRGSIYDGYKLFFKGVVDQIAEPKTEVSEKVPGLVNIIGIIPEQDVLWEGNLEKLKTLLESLGLKVNTLFGFGQSINNWKDIGLAEFNITFSTWGIEIAQYLEEKFGTQFLGLKSLPVGADETSSFLRKASEKLGLNLNAVENLIAVEQARVSYNLRKITDIYFTQGFQKEFVLVGESSLVIGLWKLLYNQLGLISKAVVVTDNLPEGEKELLNKEFGPLLAESDTQLFFSEDSAEISDIIHKYKPELILGSSLEKRAASELGIPLLEVAYPLSERVILNKSYVSFGGDIELLQDLGDEILRFKNKNHALTNFT